MDDMGEVGLYDEFVLSVLKYTFALAAFHTPYPRVPHSRRKLGAVSGTSRVTLPVRVSPVACVRLAA